jgi:Delta7-sterol 5-desaturase
LNHANSFHLPPHLGSTVGLAAARGAVSGGGRAIFRRLLCLAAYAAGSPENPAAYSVCTTVIFALVSLTLFTTGIRNHNLMYRNWADYGTAYGLLSFGLLVVFHDAYFYWTHRAMHHPRLFKVMHLTHHKSTNPSPWAAYAFHPLEAVVEALIVPIASFIIPLHGYTLLAFLLFMMVYNVYGHLGWELYPARWNRHWLGRWLNTSVSHNQHHQYFKGNYGLYFRWWDEWMGTTRPDYDTAYDRVTAP